MNAFVGAVAARPESAASRAARRAASELRRGVPVLLQVETGPSLVVLAAETLDEASLVEFSHASGGPAVLLLDAGRAATWREGAAPPQEAVAVPLPPALLQPAVLRGLADPTAPQLLAESPMPVPAPPGATAALQLAKRARLLPAILAAPAKTAPGLELQRLDLLRIGDAQVLAEQPGAEALVAVSQARVPLEDAPECRVVAFRGRDAGPEHLAILVGSPESAAAPLARIHSKCFTGDLLGSLRCDCGPQLRGALRRMAEDGAGVLLYLPQEGRGIGLANKLRAYALQDGGLDTLDANRALGWGSDERSFAGAAAMLQALGITRVRLLTNNPRKLAALQAGGIAVERVSHLVAANGVNDSYLSTKVQRMGHLT